MALSDSMFLFEILIKDLKSYKECKDYKVVGHFENIFQFNINKPNKDNIKDLKKTRAKQKTKVRITKSATKKPLAKINVHIGQSILIINKPCLLVSKMKEFPLELFICKKSNPDLKVASTRIPWSNLFINYLCNLKKKPDALPPVVDGSYNLYDENISKRLATIELSMKLTYLSNKVKSRFRSLSEDKNSKFLYTQINSKPISILSNVRALIKNNQSQDLESKNSILMAKCLEQHHRYEISKVTDSEVKYMHNKNDEITNISETKELKNNWNINKENNSSVKMIKSEPQIVFNKQNPLHKSKSYSSMYSTKETNVFQYIFGHPKCPFNGKVYHVGYFTVENDDSDPDSVRASSEHKSSSPSNPSSIKKKFQMKKCDSNCQSNMQTPGLCSDSVCSTDLPEEAAHLISVTKCKQVDCDYKKFRELPSPPDERILLDLKNSKTPCTTGIGVENKIEEVVGGVSAKLKIGEDPCFCTCECTFGFTKKTTYCNVCGGYETAGEDLSRKTAQEMPIPCPIFHKLVDKSKLKTYSTSGSESKKKEDQKSMKAGSAQRAALEKKHSDKKDFESEKDSKKGKKKRKDDRFKFNFGYKAPHIGHSRCALPCTGTLANVPRKMGWLWTAEDIPGMKVHDGWKPGAVSKKLLHMLNKAKSRRSAVEEIKRTRRLKKLLEDKPTLKICKKDGQYCIELQPGPENPEGLNNQYTPLIYKIESENNEAKLKKQARLQKRLTRAAIKEVWSDPHHQNCQMTCLKAYNEAIGVMLVEKDNIADEEELDTIYSCSCEDEEVSSSCTSSDVDFEMYFTPPIMRYKASQRKAADSLVV